MNKYVAVLIFLLTCVNTLAQSNWKFEAKIEESINYLFEGIIADKYPITMYLEYDDFCLYDNKWNYARTLKGWYYYNNRKIKLPLIGSEKYYETDDGQKEKITLYVPTNVLDNIRGDSCDLEKFNEIFIADTGSFESMQWKTSNSKSFLPVKLKVIRYPLIKTNSSILLYIRKVEMLSFNLNDNLQDFKDPWNEPYGDYINQISIKTSKEINNDFYLIFSFSVPSVIGGNGMGHCGAGSEDYLGFLHISSFEVKEFKYYQTSSCRYAFEGKYTYDKSAPEKGIKLNE